MRNGSGAFLHARSGICASGGIEAAHHLAESCCGSAGDPLPDNAAEFKLLEQHWEGHDGQVDEPAARMRWLLNMGHALQLSSIDEFARMIRRVRDSGLGPDGLPATVGGDASIGCLWRSCWASELRSGSTLHWSFSSREEGREMHEHTQRVGVRVPTVDWQTQLRSWLRWRSTRSWRMLPH